MKLSHDELKGLMKNKLMQAGLKADHADMTADVLTWSDERGYHSHGAVRVEYYSERIAKGGITSSDAATKALRMRRARVLGQAAPGVPLWRCDEETSRHPGMPYVVFPGNVGSDTTLAEVVEAWAI